MKYFGNELGGLHKEMGSIIRKKGRFEEARLMFFQAPFTAPQRQCLRLGRDRI